MGNQNNVYPNERLPKFMGNANASYPVGTANVDFRLTALFTQRLCSAATTKTLLYTTFVYLH